MRCIDMLAQNIEGDTGLRPKAGTVDTLIYVLGTEFDEDCVNYGKLERHLRQYVPEGWTVRMTWAYDQATPPDENGNVWTPLKIQLDTVRLVHTGTEMVNGSRPVLVFRRVMDLAPDAADRYLANATNRGFGPLTSDREVS